MTTNATELGTRTSVLASLAKRLRLPTPKAGHWMKLEAGKAPPTPPFPEEPELDGETYLIPLATTPTKRALKKAEEPIATGQDTSPQPNPGTDIDFTGVAPAMGGPASPDDDTAPHPKVKATRKALNRARGFERIATGGANCFRLLVSPSSGERVCSFLDRLMFEVERRGWQIEGSEGGLAIRAENEPIGFMIEEHLDQVAHVLTSREQKEKAEYERKLALAERGIGYRPWPPSIPTYDFFPNGELALKLDRNYAAEGVRRTFSDGKRQRLDNLIPSILDALERYANAVSARRKEQEEQAQRWAEAEKKRKDLERQVRVEGYRITFLRRQIERKREIDGLADLIAHWQADDCSDPEFRNLLDFAQIYRDWLAEKVAPEAVSKRISDLKLMDDDVYIYDDKRLD